MIAAILLLGHAALGGLALATLFLQSPWRSRVLTGLCLVGAGWGAGLMFFGGSLEIWRTSELGGAAGLVGAAATTAWLTAAVLSAPAGRALTCALVGVASSALALAVTNEWTVPMLLFWLCSSLAIAALAGQGRNGLWAWVVLFASDAALVAALLGNWADSRSWALPEGLDGWPFYVLLLAAVLRAGAIPVSGTWSLLGRAAPAIPLLVGGGFCLLPIALGDGDPWVASALFLLALAVSGGILLARRPWGGVAAVAAAIVALMLGSAVIAPVGLVAAGLAAIVAGGTACLWLASSKEGAPERVAAFVPLPPSLAFVAATTGVVAAVGRAVRAEDIIDEVPSILTLVLGPLALTATLAIGVRLATALPGGPDWLPRVRNGDRGALAILLSRFLLLFSVVATLMPGEWLGIASPLSVWDERRAVLLAVALVLGAAIAWVTVRRTAPTSEAARPGQPAFQASPWLDVPPPGTLGVRLLTGLVLVLALGAVGAVGWLTFEGLRLGFL